MQPDPIQADTLEQDISKTLRDLVILSRLLEDLQALPGETPKLRDCMRAGFPRPASPAPKSFP